MKLSTIPKYLWSLISQANLIAINIFVGSKAKEYIFNIINYLDIVSKESQPVIIPYLKRKLALGITVPVNNLTENAHH